MENTSYNSYPESGDSSPLSRDVGFENPPPSEDQPQHAQNYKAKFMCSYGGQIHPRPHDNQLSYIGGETKILSVERTIKFFSMTSKISALCGGGNSEVSFKYQLPGEDLDALISVTNDDDLEHMMLEYDRLYRASATQARLRLFIFSATGSASSGTEGVKWERDRFVEASNSNLTQGGERNAAIPQNNVDFLFGLENGMAPPLPVKIGDLVAEPVTPPPAPVAEVLGSDHVLNPVGIQRQIQELKRLQIRDQEQLAMYRKKTEDADSLSWTGEYYADKLPENAPPVTIPVNLQQHAPPAAGFWSDKQIPFRGFPATLTTTASPPPPEDHPVYMISAPGQVPATVYHSPSTVPDRAPAPAAPQMLPPVTGLAGQVYYPNVQRMPPELYREQPVCSMIAQLPPTHHSPISSMPQQAVRPPSGGVIDTAHGQTAAYDGRVYYAAPVGVVVPLQYQGVSMAVSGEMRGGAEGKLVNNVSQC